MALKSQKTLKTKTNLRTMDDAKIRRLATVVRDSNDAIIISDFEGRITAWNRGAELMYGYTEKDALQMTLWQITPSKKAAEKKEFIRRLKEGEAITSFETQRETKDGRVLDVWMTVTKLVDDTGKPVGIASTERDITGRNRKEEEFKSAKSLLDTVIDSSPFAMWISDREGMLIRTNRSLRETLNLTDEQLIGKYNVLNDTNLEMQGVMPMVRAVFEMYTPASFIIPWKASNAGDVDFKGGRDLYIDVSIFPILDKNGELTNAVCQWVNITERKQAEEALKESEARYRNLVENASIGIFRTKIDGSRVLDANPKLCEILGLTREEFVGQPSAIAWAHPERRDELVRLLREKGNVSNYEIDVRTKSGEIRAVLMSMTTYPELGYLEGGLQDITERKRAEEALSVAALYARSLIEASLDPLVTISPEGKITDVNEATIKVTGVSRDKLIGTDFSIYFTAPEMAKEGYQQAFAKGSVTDYPLTIRHRDGKLMDVLYNASVYKDINGKVLGVFAAARDITERKQAVESLERALVDLARSNKELEQFAYVASHDLQEPLRMVSSYTQLLAQKYEGQLDDKAKKYIAYAVDGAIRMQRLINDLLTYSRISTQGKPSEPVDSHSVLGEALRNLAATIEENRAVITNEDLPMVRADGSQLMLVFQNLIANAIKFRGEEIPRVNISIHEQGREWVFSVKDNGIGIDKQYADRIFVIFQRLHTKEEYPGTGIGLAVCKRIIERHGGRIWFESELGKGTIFYFSIPKQERTTV